MNSEQGNNIFRKDKIADLSDRLETMYNNQLAAWKLASDHYAGLQQVILKSFVIDRYKIQIQYNPKRIISSSAKVDAASIKARPCFLCTHNRPVEQEGIAYHNNYLILLNPYPVFHHHFTIPSVQHVPQRVLPNFIKMLDLARDLHDYTVLYNGPNCGASAPDHFHFQVIPKGILPVEADFLSAQFVTKRASFNNIEIYTWDHYGRTAVTLTGSETEELYRAFRILFGILESSFPVKDEAMLNVLVRYQNDHWIVHVFPRKEHRPRQYFEPEGKRLMISPASIDMGGIFIMPREQDFNRITASDVKDIFRQVCPDKDFIEGIVNKMISNYE